MCTTALGTLTLATMLDDPLIQAMMRSDGVSEHDHEALLFRVANALAGREQDAGPELELATLECGAGEGLARDCGAPELGAADMRRPELSWASGDRRYRRFPL